MSLSVRASALSTLPVDKVWFVEVVEHAQSGDESAFNILFQYYNAQICRYLTRMVGDDEEGRDLAQETFLKAWRALPQMSERSQFDAWLYRIATNTAFDHLRRRKFRWPLWKNYARDEEPECMSTAGPEEQIEEAEHIKLALAQLSPQYRACLLLQLVAGFTQRETAVSLNLSEKSVSIYVKRGCEQFRQAYKRLENGQEVTERRRPAR